MKTAGFAKRIAACAAAKARGANDQGLRSYLCEMVAELHKHFGSAALLAVNEWHPRLIKPKQP